MTGYSLEKFDTVWQLQAPSPDPNDFDRDGDGPGCEDPGELAHHGI
ncbi:MAG: hypothetical protein M3O70_21350 [Actinomycetota bacterium]|nr:hypothetical protein [Actinomycetota bacterium]